MVKLLSFAPLKQQRSTILGGFNRKILGMLRQGTGTVCAMSRSRGEASGRLENPRHRPTEGSCPRRQQAVRQRTANPHLRWETQRGPSARRCSEGLSPPRANCFFLASLFLFQEFSSRRHRTFLGPALLRAVALQLRLRGHSRLLLQAQGEQIYLKVD